MAVRGVRALLGAVVFGVLLCASAPASGAVVVDPALEQFLASHPGAPAPVIVALDVPVQSESGLDATGRQQQRRRIRGAGDRVADIARVHNRRRGSSDRVLETLPYVGTSADSAALAALKGSDDVKAVYLAGVSHVSLAQSTAQINAQAAWSSQIKGTGQTVAVIDTGVDNNHPWFAGKFANQACFTRNERDPANPANNLYSATCPGGSPGVYTSGPKTGPGAAQPPTSTVVNGTTIGVDAFRLRFGHGTHVAGIAAGKNSGGVGGVAPEAKILAVNVASQTWLFNWFNPSLPALIPLEAIDDRDLVAGLDWVNQQRTLFNIAAVNLSLGFSLAAASSCDGSVTGGNVAIKNSINSLVANGISVVVASGNDSNKSGISFPACLANVTSVGATDDVTGTVTAFSNSANNLDVLAPGAGIQSANLGSTGTISLDGTSMAAPHVAGAIALYKQKNPSATPAQVEAALKQSSVPVGDTNGLIKPRIRVDGALGLAPGLSQASTPPVAATEEATAKADFNGDGKSDVAMLYDYGNQNTALWTSNGSASGLSAPVNKWTSGAGNWNWAGTKLAAGDFNGDGRGDVALFYNYGNANSSLFVAYGSPGGLTTPVQKWTSGAGNWEWGASKLVSGDFNGDGKTDIGVLYGYASDNTGLWILQGTSGGFAAPVRPWLSGAGNWNWAGTKLVSGDFNGDGKGDVGLLYSYGGDNTALWIAQGTSTGMTAPALKWSSGAGNWNWAGSKLVPGDFNGDGKGDVGILYNYGGDNAALWLLYGTATGVAAPVNKWTSGPGNWSWASSKLVPGDFNGDGKGDVAAFYSSFAWSNADMFLFTGTASGVNPFTRVWQSGVGNWNYNGTRAV